MGKQGRTQDVLNNLAHRRYVAWATGTGAKTEFALPRTVTRLDDLLVVVAGLIRRPAEPGNARDYKVRGISAGYSGESNTVKFTAAPANGADVGFILNAP